MHPQTTIQDLDELSSLLQVCDDHKLDLLFVLQLSSLLPGAARSRNCKPRQ